MANYFIDTSALVKYYHAEDGTQEVTRLLEEPAARHYISRLSLVETVSAFAIKCRMRHIDERDQGQQRGIRVENRSRTGVRDERATDHGLG